MNSQLIPRQIANEEILLKLVFSDDLKNGEINGKEVFVDTNDGISHQRKSYTVKDICIALGNAIKIRKQKNRPNCQFEGFLTFSYNNFQIAIKEHREKRESFDAAMKHTPLDASEQYLQINENTPIYTSDIGYPAHADMIYINPANTESETVKTAQRVFSKILSKYCSLEREF